MIPMRYPKVRDWIKSQSFCHSLTKELERLPGGKKATFIKEKIPLFRPSVHRPSPGLLII